MKTFTVLTGSRDEFIDITQQVQKAICDTGGNGVATVYVPHTTAGITINESADPDVRSDIIKSLDRIVPWKDGYAHFEGNSSAHIKSSLMGSSVNIIVTDGKLQLGAWQNIYFCEFDGPRTRNVWVSLNPACHESK